MLRPWWRKSLGKAVTKPGRRPRSLGSRPVIDVLEDRTVPSFFTPPTSAVGVTPVAEALGDFNSDGHLDLAVANANAGSSSVSVLLGNGDGTFQAPRNSAAGTGPRSVAVGDFNGDGRLDFAVGDPTTFLSVFTNAGNGNFSAASLNTGVCFALPGGRGL